MPTNGDEANLPLLLVIPAGAAALDVPNPPNDTEEDNLLPLEEGNKLLLDETNKLLVPFGMFGVFEMDCDMILSLLLTSPTQGGKSVVDLFPHQVHVAFAEHSNTSVSSEIQTRILACRTHQYNPTRKSWAQLSLEPCPC